MTERRLGTSGSATRKILLDAAEELMRTSGYAAVTSRRLAAQAGLKPQLVHYYFRTMDDLFVALFQRVAEDLFRRQEAIGEADHPLDALWALCSDPSDVVLNYEFVALGNHRKVIQSEIAQFGDTFRTRQAAIIARALAKTGDSDAKPAPVVLAVVTELLARGMVLEAALGMSAGHAETRAAIAQAIAALQATMSAQTTAMIPDSA
jgi:AcrR family transcriptional regulator